MSERGQSNDQPGGQRDAALRAVPLRLSRRQGGRAAAAMRELTEPSPIRLSDRQRIAVERLCDRLVGDVEDELRGLILADDARPDDDGLDASLGAAHVPLAAPILETAGVLPDRRIVALALERSDMHEAARRLRRQGSPGDRIGQMVAGEEGEVSSTAMALLIAESRANMRFDEALLPAADLDPDIRDALIWKVAAALRHYALAHYPVSVEAMDGVAAKAAAKLRDDLAGETGLGEAAAGLAAALEDEIDAGLLSDILFDGRLALYCALLAKACALGAEGVWALASDPEGVGHALLLRAAGLDRQEGASLVMALLEAAGDRPSDEDDTPDWYVVWEEFTAESASGTLAHWRVDPAYREALSAIAALQGGA